ncbi:hypothetical protein E4T50_03415 [Aureobasidium sp. EXF-12298]|nr:hypothetical protein E4T50_03415 [Aureobasidium sp. EXF-12298]
MDSMRSLNTSLPRTSPRRNHQPPEELLSAFKAAALSVTNLYKNAASEQARSRAAGYQDALDDLLSFLDKENLGLGDGEGWSVRQWATERFDGAHSAARESEDEEEEQEEQPRSLSPEVVRKPTTAPVAIQDQPQPEPVNTELPPTQHQQQPQVTRTDATVPQADTFTFRSSLAYPPPNHDREVDMDASNNPPTDSPNSSTSANPVRLEVHSRRRNNHNRSNNNNNNNRIASINLGSMGSGAGSKRKNLGDFFDISGLSFGNNGRDGSDRGGKRGRHV